MTGNDSPVAALGPVPPQRRLVSREAIAAAARTAPRVDADRFRADLNAGMEDIVEVRGI